MRLETTATQRSAKAVHSGPGCGRKPNYLEGVFTIALVGNPPLRAMVFCRSFLPALSIDVDSATLIFDTHWPQFEQDVIDASHAQPMLVDFWADWCPPCATLTPILERLIPSYGGRIRLAKIEVDVDDNMKLAGRYALRGFPTVLLFVKGEMAARFHSARSEPWVRAFIAEFAGIE